MMSHTRLSVRKPWLLPAIAAFVSISMALSACTLGGKPKSSAGLEGQKKAVDEASRNRFEPTRKTTVELNDLYVEGDGGGGSARNRITVEPSGDKGVKVGFQEDEVRGTGDMWRSSAWQATTVAFLLTGALPTKMKITFDCVGPTDGPSAGGLLTVGVLAAMSGDKVRDDVIMTGTINPDGSIGPVGGIPHKLDGAKEAGKKRVLIPVGQSFSEDIITGESVDVIAKGKEMDLEVEEVSNIYEAYEKFTGKKLPRWGDKDVDVKLTKEVSDRFEAKTKEWMGKYAEARNKYGTLTPELQEYYAASLGYVDALAAQSDSFTKQGESAAAFIKAVFAAAEANGLYQQAQLNALFIAQGQEAAFSQIVAQSTASTRIETTADDLERKRPKTVTDAGALVEGFGDLGYAIGYYQNGQGDLDAEYTTPEDAENALYGASTEFNYADLQVDLARDLVDIQEGLDGPKLDKSTDVNVIADFMSQAADAGFVSLQALFASEAADEGVSSEVFLGFLAQNDLDIVTVLQAKNLRAFLEEQLKDEETLPYARLGLALNLYVTSAKVMAKYISLKAVRDDSDNIVGYKREKALGATLDLAEDQTRRAVGVLDSKKVDPSLVAANYEIAKVDRDSADPAEKLESLAGFWNAYVYARIEAYLGGFASTGLT